MPLPKLPPYLQVNKEATGALLLSNTGTGIWLAAVTLGMYNTHVSAKNQSDLSQTFFRQIGWPDFHDFQERKHLQP